MVHQGVEAQQSGAADLQVIIAEALEERRHMLRDTNGTGARETWGSTCSAVGSMVATAIAAAGQVPRTGASAVRAEAYTAAYLTAVTTVHLALGEADATNARKRGTMVSASIATNLPGPQTAPVAR